MYKAKLLFVIYFSLGALLAGANGPILNVYNWSGYLPEKVLSQFVKETGIQVNYSTYESNEALYTKLKMTSQHHYDVIVPSSYTVHRMIQEGILLPLDKSKLVSLQSLDVRLLDQPYDPGNRYSVPYLFNTSGLVVNTRYYHPKDFVSWEALWQSHLINRLLILDDMREVFSITLLLLGFSPNTCVTKEIEQAYLKLRQLLKNVRVFSSEGVTSLYVDEDLVLGMGWNGDIYRARQANKAIQFCYPKEGYILSIDNLAIPAGARHMKEAYQFINFLLRPEIAAQISISTGYASANRLARNYLPQEMLADRIVYPDENTLKRGVLQLSVGSKASVYEKYWELLKVER